VPKLRAAATLATRILQTRLLSAMGNSTSLQDAERAILAHGASWYERWQRNHLRPAPSDDGKEDDDARGVQITFKISDVKAGPVKAGGPPDTIHTVKYESSHGVSAEKHTSCPLVVIHGYAWGVGLMYSTMPALADRWPGEVYSIDSMGCGLSTRKEWTLGYGDQSNLHDVESYFLHALNHWRMTKGFQKITLCGHSVGGYLSFAYAERYPEHVDRLILASPVGVPPIPESNSDPEALARLPWYFRLARSLWNKGTSPFTVVRNTPVLGRGILSRYVTRRFADKEWTNAEAKELLTEYMYRNWCHEKISGGGYAHSTLLVPGAFARSPLCERLPILWDKLPVSFIYGTRDWMTWTHAEDVATAIEEEVGAAAGRNFDIVRIADAGHQLMVDNPIGFADAVCAVGTAEHGSDQRKVRGRIVGYAPLATEAGINLAEIKVGDIVSAEFRGRNSFMAGSPEGSDWYDAEVMGDNGDGSFKIVWMEDGRRTNQVTSAHPGHKLRKKNGDRMVGGEAKS